MAAKIDQARCSGCGRCISACKSRLIAFETRDWKKTAVLHDIERCDNCGECASRCVVEAISTTGVMPEIVTIEDLFTHTFC